MNDAIVQSILDSRKQILLYSPEHEAEAREIMQGVAAGLAEQLWVSDPALDNLVIVDRGDHLDDWQSVLPTAHVTTVAQIVDGSDHVSRHQNVVSLSPDFLRRNISRPLRSATRFYAMTSNPKSAIHFMRLDAMVVLEDAA